MPAGHPLADSPSVEFAEVQTMPIIMFPKEHRCRQLIDASCSTSGFSLEPFIETNTIDSIFSLIKSGASVSVLSKSLIHLYNDGSIRAIPIIHPVLSRQVAIIHNRGSSANRLRRIFRCCGYLSVKRALSVRSYNLHKINIGVPLNATAICSVKRALSISPYSLQTSNY
nr:LysR family transcriptional regulator substrate-binding protein [Paenibacillus agri]